MSTSLFVLALNVPFSNGGASRYIPQGASSSVVVPAIATPVLEAAPDVVMVLAVRTPTLLRQVERPLLELQSKLLLASH